MTNGSSNGLGLGKGSSVLGRGFTVGASSGSRRSGRVRGLLGSILTGPGSVLGKGSSVLGRVFGVVGASTVAVTLGRPVPKAGSVTSRNFPVRINFFCKNACSLGVNTVESAKAFSALTIGSFPRTFFGVFTVTRVTAPPAFFIGLKNNNASAAADAAKKPVSTGDQPDALASWYDKNVPYPGTTYKASDNGPDDG